MLATDHLGPSPSHAGVQARSAIRVVAFGDEAAPYERSTWLTSRTAPRAALVVIAA
jgi:hypothetical protein